MQTIRLEILIDTYTSCICISLFYLNEMDVHLLFDVWTYMLLYQGRS